jgi:CubicO group peptidase (beta-lactamase class C family)
MKLPVLLVLLLQACALPDDVTYRSVARPPDVPGERWEVVAEPSELGWSVEGLAAAKREAQTVGSSAVMVIHDGRLIAAWGNTTGRWYVASMRKSLLSLLYGELVASGAVNLDATLKDLNVDDVTPLSDVEKQARVKDLLTSTSGVYLPSAASDVTLPVRGSTSPGTQFVYNNWGFNAAATIFNQARPQGDLYTAFEDRIARPLGLEDFVRSRDGRYERIAESMHPAYHFDMTARDLARVGLLVARQGRWSDAQVLEEAWLAESTGPKVNTAESEGSMGYGFMWWVCTEGSQLAALGMPVGTRFANGNLNQFIAVVPSHQLVIVHRGPDRNVEWSAKAKLIAAIVAAAPQR